MEFLRAVLAVVLINAIAAQPLLAQVARVAPVSGQASPTASAAAGNFLGGVQALRLSLPATGVGSVLSLNPSLPGIVGAAVELRGSALPGAPSVPDTGLTAAPLSAQIPAAISAPADGARSPDAEAPKSLGKAAPVSLKIEGAALEVAAFAAELERAEGDDAGAAAARLFAILTGEALNASAALRAEPAGPRDQAFSGAPGSVLPGSGLEPSSGGTAEASREVPPAKASFARVFKDPERDKSFWRYLWGSTISLFGLRMYVVGLPYLISSLTKNSLAENHDARAGSAEVVKTLVRENRSLARIAHWAAQAVSYLSIPFFTRDAREGPGKWFVRSAFIRGAILALVPTLFFASGLLSVQGAILALFGIIAAQSFFQGLYCTMEKATVASIIGDKSVTAAERLKANSILTFASAAVAIIAPAIGGQLSLVRDFFGKTGVGGPVIYAIYAAATALAGLFFAGISLIGGRAAAKADGEPGAKAGGIRPAGESGGLKGLWLSLRDGLKLIAGNRVLRTLLGLNLISFLFSDPLTFSVLPEFAEGIIKAGAGVGPLFDIPVLGWFLKGLTSTPMGYFGLMAAMASVGSMAATLLMGPLRRLLERLGVKTEEAMTVPFVLLAALEIPLFWLMIGTGSLAGAAILFALQSFASGFAGVMLASVSQKALGSFDRGQTTKIIAAQSLLQILAAIAATYLYGFALAGVPLATLLTIAAVSVTVLGLVRAASPWLLFERGRAKG